MSQPAGASRVETPPAEHASTGQLSDRLTRSVRAERRLAPAEVSTTAEEIGAGALLVVAGVLARNGEEDLQHAAPPVPTKAISSVEIDIATLVEIDIATLKESASR
ncbi:hypothetical protein [Modestobacter roseus]|uniref:Uncharacterized protein n=1 Tax=Modestobacter roseus TaxID=1181884 RepID=A0A562INJ3_9ACTN|nr:hypothetical protein [Modestobacter roseus]MQA32440.1 hypothetical protein [Modestobacter roseus]TWH72295.1 hypothetical protein JD78_00806 [Modestobacter roseus]